MKAKLFKVLVLIFVAGIMLFAIACDFSGPTYSEGLEYKLNEDGLSYTVVGIGTCKDDDLVIPNSYEGLPVTTIGEKAFERCEKITSVVLPDSVTSIGSSAFQFCISLTSVEIPNSVTSIGRGAFCSCESLPSVVIGDSVTSIGSPTFYDCSSLTSIYVS